MSQYVHAGKIYSLEETRKLLPNMSIPDGADISFVGFVPFRTVAPPPPETNCTVREGAPTADGYQTWIQVPNPPLAPKSQRAHMKQLATDRRYNREVGGISLPNGVRIDTGRDDQNSISNTIVMMERAGLPSINFKAASGFVEITYAELNQVAVAVAMHKQACYNWERERWDAVDAATNDELSALQERWDAEDGL